MAYEEMQLQATPLSAIAEAFEDLSETVQKSREDLRLKAFCDSCALVSVLFNSLGLAFKFAELEYCSKVRGLSEAAKIYPTLHNILDVDVQNNRVKCPGSLSRNLRRVRQEAASSAYAQTCAPYHSWAVRAAATAGMYALPTRDQLLMSLKETDESAEFRMKRYMKAVGPIIQYIDKLYISRNINLDW
ncbi:ACD11-like protein [Bienertia sinuspersici]